MKKKRYNLLVFLTFVLPMGVYLVLVATVFQIQPTAIVGGKVTEVEVVQDDFLYAHALNDDVTFNGHVELHNGEYALKFEEQDIIKFKDGYFQFKLAYQAKQTDVPTDKWVDVKMFEMQKQQGYKIPLAIIFSGLGALIVGLVISNKMQWHKKKPRLATFLALLTGTLVLLILNTMIGSILGVFAVATGSFGLYCIEYLIQQGKITEKDSKKAKSDLERILESTLRNLK